MAMRSNNAIEYDLTPEEILENRRIAARRARDEERARRFIEDPWSRTVGIDRDGIERQRAEKRAIREAKRAEEAEYARGQQDLVRALDAIELESKEKSHGKRGRLLAVWAEQKAERERREFLQKRQQDKWAASLDGHSKAKIRTRLIAPLLSGADEEVDGGADRGEAHSSGGRAQG